MALRDTRSTYTNQLHISRSLRRRPFRRTAYYAGFAPSPMTELLEIVIQLDWINARLEDTSSRS